MTRPLLVGALLACALNASCALFRQAETPDYGRALPAGADALLLLGPDERRPDVRGTWFERDEIMPALERSLAWTRTAHSNQFFPIAGIDHERALQSLERFAELLGPLGNLPAQLGVQDLDLLAVLLSLAHLL